MKTLLIFSNPFGLGPSGKAISLYKYISENSKGVDVFLCGRNYLRQIAGKNCNFINVDERNEASISCLVRKIKGEKYILSSQNRFSIKVAIKNNVQCAFIDGLSWFWKEIPEDHFLADIIFWLKYPEVEKLIPSGLENKIFIIHAILEKFKKEKNLKKEGVLMYIGGCKNPLTPLPKNYLNLVSRVLENVNSKGFKIELATDNESQRYLARNQAAKVKIKNYNHNDFLTKISKTKKFITNGGQTATIEAINFYTPISFFLPINLSQLALITKLKSLDPYCFTLNWSNYTKIPLDIYNYTEKDTIKFLNEKSKDLLNRQRAFDQLCDDFINLGSINKIKSVGSNFLHSIGSTGAEDIYKVLQRKWKI